ncbi:hypothetical protein DL98DRAFT_588214 [Cadophora sp. DSE1049]|nr:hypothetical protein DL98DRAFT_588214 [Cadophora sp. DSE1049]
MTAFKGLQCIQQCIPDAVAALLPQIGELLLGTFAIRLTLALSIFTGILFLSAIIQQAKSSSSLEADEFSESKIFGTFTKIWNHLPIFLRVVHSYVWITTFTLQAMSSFGISQSCCSTLYLPRTQSDDAESHDHYQRFCQVPDLHFRTNNNLLRLPRANIHATENCTPPLQRLALPTMKLTTLLTTITITTLILLVLTATTLAAASIPSNYPNDRRDSIPVPGRDWKYARSFTINASIKYLNSFTPYAGSNFQAVHGFSSNESAIFLYNDNHYTTGPKRSYVADYARMDTGGQVFDKHGYNIIAWQDECYLRN